MGGSQGPGPWSEVEPHLHGAIDSFVDDVNKVLMDATHAQLNWRQRLMHRSLEARHIQWTGWWLQTPLDQCLAWNRSRQGSVPEAVIHAMHCRLSSPPTGQNSAKDS